MRAFAAKYGVSSYVRPLNNGRTHRRQAPGDASHISTVAVAVAVAPDGPNNANASTRESGIDVVPPHDCVT